MMKKLDGGGREIRGKVCEHEGACVIAYGKFQTSAISDFSLTPVMVATLEALRIFVLRKIADRWLSSYR